jgi:hypothetical protein
MGLGQPPESATARSRLPPQTCARRACACGVLFSSFGVVVGVSRFSLSVDVFQLAFAKLRTHASLNPVFERSRRWGGCCIESAIPHILGRNAQNASAKRKVLPATVGSRPTNQPWRSESPPCCATYRNNHITKYRYSSQCKCNNHRKCQPFFLTCLCAIVAVDGRHRFAGRKRWIMEGASAAGRYLPRHARTALTKRIWNHSGKSASSTARTQPSSSTNR